MRLMTSGRFGPYPGVRELGSGIVGGQEHHRLHIGSDAVHVREVLQDVSQVIESLVTLPAKGNLQQLLGRDVPFVPDVQATPFPLNRVSHLSTLRTLMNVAIGEHDRTPTLLPKVTERRDSGMSIL